MRRAAEHQHHAALRGMVSLATCWSTSIHTNELAVETRLKFAVGPNLPRGSSKAMIASSRRAHRRMQHSGSAAEKHGFLRPERRTPAVDKSRHVGPRIPDGSLAHPDDGPLALPR